MSNSNSDLIKLRTITPIFQEGPEGSPRKLIKVFRVNEYFNKYGIDKVEPVVHPRTFKKARTKCMIYYKPTSSYYKIDESIESVIKKIEGEEENRKIGFRYKNRNW